jgi:tRNA-dihydrouridine synthase B
MFPVGAVAVAAAPLRVGSIPLRSRVLCAPMAGITDAPFRRIAAEMGAGLVCTEMVAAEALVRSVEASLALLRFDPDVHPVAAQIVGCDPAVMAEAARICVERGADVVDVNLGCPVRKVVNLGSGAALARDVRATARVLEAMVDAVWPVPVTAKMRLGWDDRTINAPELARALQDVGVQMVTVHGRTRCQGYAGQADWDWIARVKEAVDIPVIGSGDVTDAERIATLLAEGRADGVIVARGMLGNFWLLRQAVHRLETGETLPDQPFAERVDLTRRHLDMLVEHYGERRALRIGRKYVAWTIKGCSGAARLRERVQGMDSREALTEILEAAKAAGEGPNGFFRPVFTSGEG